MLECFKKIYDRSWDIRLNSFEVSWTQIVLLFEKGILWENTNTNVYLFFPIMHNVSEKFLH